MFVFIDVGDVDWAFIIFDLKLYIGPMVIHLSSDVCLMSLMNVFTI